MARRDVEGDVLVWLLRLQNPSLEDAVRKANTVVGIAGVPLFGYDLVGREELPGRTLRVDQRRVSSPRPGFGHSREENPSATVLTADTEAHLLRSPAGPHPRASRRTPLSHAYHQLRRLPRTREP